MDQLYKIYLSFVKFFNPDGSLRSLYFLRSVSPKFSTSTVLSIFCFKHYNCRTVNVTHLERLTGVVWIVKFKLIKFCLESFYELVKFRLIFNK